MIDKRLLEEMFYGTVAESYCGSCIAVHRRSKCMG